MILVSKQEQIDTLSNQGFVVVPNLFKLSEVALLRKIAVEQLNKREEPIELEISLKYPGAPHSLNADGGNTIRRLLDAYNRSLYFAKVALNKVIQEFLYACLGENIIFSRTHHNCLMTKHPYYGSITDWHRDIRYWSFTRPELISVWLALGKENINNGGLKFIPGSHLMKFSDNCFDNSKFFRSDIAKNILLIQRAVCPTIFAGDAVFFHCNTLHSAGLNLSNNIKFSLVFTYHGISNPPKLGTRSSSKQEILLY